jgi:hypothetical protein
MNPRPILGLKLAVPVLFAALLLSAGAAVAEDCRVHGRSVDGSMLLDAIRAARLDVTAESDDESSENDEQGPHETEQDDDSWDVGGTFGPVETVRFSTSEGTWMNLDVHPSGELIVFDLLGDLYTVPMEGGEATRITEGAAYDFQPRLGRGLRRRRARRAQGGHGGEEAARRRRGMGPVGRVDLRAQACHGHQLDRHLGALGLPPVRRIGDLAGRP